MAAGDPFAVEDIPVSSFAVCRRLDASDVAAAAVSSRAICFNPAPVDCIRQSPWLLHRSLLSSLRPLKHRLIVDDGLGSLCRRAMQQLAVHVSKGDDKGYEIC